MTSQTYQHLILAGIKGLPPEALEEIAQFIYFLRKRTLQPQLFEEELQTALLRTDLQAFSQTEEAHLEKEFEDYERRYPKEE